MEDGGLLKRQSLTEATPAEYCEHIGTNTYLQHSNGDCIEKHLNFFLGVCSDRKVLCRLNHVTRIL